MIVNLLYAAFRLGAAFHFRSAWFLSLGVFHLVLGLLRANLGLAENVRNCAATAKRPGCFFY